MEVVNPMSKRSLHFFENADDRRSSNRLPIEREIRYSIKVGRKTIIRSGEGKTVNMSGTGILFTTQSDLHLHRGQRVELAVNWPALLNNVLPLKLVAQGRVIRIEEKQAAMAIESYEFKTCGTSGLYSEHLRYKAPTLHQNSPAE
jgi:hypothetical protein